MFRLQECNFYLHLSGIYLVRQLKFHTKKLQKQIFLIKLGPRDPEMVC